MTTHDRERLRRELQRRGGACVVRRAASATVRAGWRSRRRSERASRRFVDGAAGAASTRRASSDGWRSLRSPCSKCRLAALWRSSRPTASGSRGSASTTSSRWSGRSDDPRHQPLGTRVRVARGRRSPQGYDGLFGLVKQGLGRDPLSGDLFLFVDARRKGGKVFGAGRHGTLHLPEEARALAIRRSLAGRRRRGPLGALKGNEQELQEKLALGRALADVVPDRTSRSRASHPRRQASGDAQGADGHPEANLAMKWIGERYAIDERAEGDLAKLAEPRRTESAPVIATMKTWLWNQAVSKSLSTGNAAAHVIANWDRLTRFLEDARVPLTTTPPSVASAGRSSAAGTTTDATFCTLLETAKRCGVDPARYLREAVVPCPCELASALVPRQPRRARTSPPWSAAGPRSRACRWARRASAGCRRR